MEKSSTSRPCIATCERLSRSAKRGRVQNPRRGLAHIAHQKPDRAGALVVTLLASTVCRLARARQRSERSLDRAQHLSGGDQRGRAREEVTSAASLSAVQKAMVLKLQENEFEKATRNMFALGNIRDQDRTLAVLLGEHDQRL